MQYSISSDLGSAVLGHGSIIILPEIIIILDINGPKYLVLMFWNYILRDL